MRLPSRIAACAAISLACAAPAVADHGDRADSDTRYELARVLDVKPLIRSVDVEIPVRECYEREVVRRPDRGRGGVGKMIAGGIIGGVIGRQFGDGSGRDAMTVLGSVIGAASASDERGRHDEPDVEKYCETTYEYERRDRVEGFRVTYELDGRTYTTRTTTDPGDTIRVRVDVRPLVD